MINPERWEDDIVDLNIKTSSKERITRILMEVWDVVSMVDEEGTFDVDIMISLDKSHKTETDKITDFNHEMNYKPTEE